MLFEHEATPAVHGAGLNRLRRLVEMHESGTYVEVHSGPPMSCSLK
jgi:hypothetical protein